MFFIKCWQNAASYKSNYLYWTLVYVYLTFFFLQLWYPLIILHFIKDNSLLSSFLQKQQQKQSSVLSHPLYYLCLHMYAQRKLIFLFKTKDSKTGFHEACYAFASREFTTVLRVRYNEWCMHHRCYQRVNV